MRGARLPDVVSVYAAMRVALPAPLFMLHAVKHTVHRSDMGASGTI